MLTVKLMKATRYPGESDTRFSTKLVEATEVDIHILRPGELYEVSARNGELRSAYYIADPEKGRPKGFADEVDFYYAAYVENSSGATTEMVRP